MDIQGLRAIAVLAVVLYHAGAGFVPGGYVGVDIFFVISGYLITGILLGEMERGAYSLSGFYERRVRRLFPALFVMLPVVLIVAAFTLSPHAYAELGKTALGAIFFVSNFVFFNLTGYFDSDAHTRPLLHTWSLAVEEQFYLIFPPLLFVIAKYARRSLRTILWAGAAASLVACVWVLPRHPEAAFYLAPFRGYELLMGAALAGLPARGSQRVRDALSLLGLALIAVSLFAFQPTLSFPGLAALIPCGGAALMLFAGADGTTVGGRLISSAPFAFFGALSYSLYLWHWPVLVLGESILLRTPAPLEIALMVALAIGLATLFWRYIEQPFLRHRAPRWRVLAVGGAAMVAMSALVAPLILTHGAPQRFRPAALNYFASDEDISPRRWQCHDFLGSIQPYAHNCTLGAPNVDPHVAVWGDSSGVEMAYAWGEQLAARGQSLLQLTASGCPPSLDYSRFDQRLCAAHNPVVLDGLTHDARIGTVVFTTNYMSYPRADWPAIFAGQARVLDALAAAHKRIVLVYPVPSFGYDVPAALGVLSAYGRPSSDDAMRESAFENDFAPAIAFLDHERARLHATAFYPTAVLCDRALCYADRPGIGVLYFNRDHLSETGARLIAARFPLTTP